ncbi:hypothetical protein [Longimicrobium sp.]|nr:hypothetical protein [Longimicrobium sp.]HSU15792.1 hypothetical protein [Longimicrobium sp.]
MDKKPYVSPQLTQHGNAVEMTAGEHGRALELINFRPGHNAPANKKR